MANSEMPKAMNARANISCSFSGGVLHIHFQIFILVFLSPPESKFPSSNIQINHDYILFAPSISLRHISSTSMNHSTKWLWRTHKCQWLLMQDQILVVASVGVFSIFISNFSCFVFLSPAESDIQSTKKCLYYFLSLFYLILSNNF